MKTIPIKSAPVTFLLPENRHSCDAIDCKECILHEHLWSQCCYAKMLSKYFNTDTNPIFKRIDVPTEIKFLSLPETEPECFGISCEDCVYHLDDFETSASCIQRRVLQKYFQTPSEP